MKPKIAIFFSGRGSNMAALINAAAAEDYPGQITLAFSNRADAAGLAIARAAGIETICIPSKPFGRDRQAHEREIHDALTAKHIEIICLAGYMRLLTPYLVERWAGKMLNIHPSLLPAYPGLDTHARVLAAGETRHGCTVHLVTETMDDGPILAQAEIPVLPGDTEDTLAARVLEQEHIIYPAALADYIRRRPLPDPTPDR